MSDTPKPPSTVVLRARNGDVIRADETGLEMRLSDRVIDDIGARLGRAERLDPGLLGDVDAWALARDGDWLRFQALMPGTPHPRGYLRRAAGGDIFAETGGPVLGLLSLGGSRRACGRGGRPAFAWHLVCPDDEIGAVGMAGLEPAAPTDRLATLRDQTLDSAIADAVLRARADQGRALPLIYLRSECDRSASLADLTGGPALDNLLTAAANLKSAAESLGKRARLLAVGVDFLREDIATPLDGFAPAMRALLARLEDGLWQAGYAAPLFLSLFDGSEPDRIPAQWDLAARPGAQRLVFSAPSYACAQDRWFRLTPEGLAARAMIEAAAVEECDAGRGWSCPVPLLAEFGSDRQEIVLRTNAERPLVLDPDDPFGAGPAGGFTLAGGPEGLEITDLRIGDAPCDVILRLNRPAPRAGLRLRYGWAVPGRVRDDWGSALFPGARRWCLPAELEVHG